MSQYDVTNEDGVLLGRYAGKTPKHAAVKAFQVWTEGLVNEDDITSYKIHVKECNNDYDNKLTFSFLVTRKRRDVSDTETYYENLFQKLRDESLE